MCNYGDLASVNRLVNDNKHDRVHRVHDVPNSVDVYQGSWARVMISVSPIYPVRPDGRALITRSPSLSAPWHGQHLEISVSPESKTSNLRTIPGSAVQTYMDFCMTVITATRFTLGYVYSELYGVPERIFRE